MQVLPVIVPYIQTTSNIAISCRVLRGWLSNNGFPIQSTKKICLETYSFYKLLEHPGIDKWIWKKIFGAVMNEDPKYLQLLLQSGADVEVKNNLGETALIYAAESGKTDCLQLLLENKANIEAKSAWRGTALSHAAINGRIDCLKLLLENKANTEAVLFAEHTAIMCAARTGEIDCLKLLLERGAKVDPITRQRYPQYAELWGDSTL